MQKKTDLTVSEINRLRGAIEKSLAKLNPHASLTSLALETRSHRTVAERLEFLRGIHQDAPDLFRGKPRFAVLAALYALNRGAQSLTRPLRDVVRTVGARKEDDAQLADARFFDAVKAFTVKPSEIGQFFAARFDGCEGPLNDVETFAAKMRRETFSPATGLFELVAPNFDRYAVAGIPSLLEAMRHEAIRGRLLRG